MPTAPWMFWNGELVRYEDCRLHGFSGVVKYGCAVFEGLRAYWSEREQELFVFRLREHLERLAFGLRLLRLEGAPPLAAIAEGIRAMLRRNALREPCHIRVIAYLDGDDELAATGPVGVVAGAVPRASSRFVADGMHLKIASWTRLPEAAMPPRVKATGNYLNNRLAELEAKRDGYDGAVLLTGDGKIAETSGACLFLVRDGCLVTPSVTSDILESITRRTLLELAPEVTGRPAVERAVDRSELWAAEEVFACGTGWEIVPVVSVDRIPIGDGRPGPLTRRLQEAYFAIVRGDRPERRGWLTPVWAS
ncbi:MAG: branched-chain-amino-acid transaminase [Geminicoccaceae bacterium]|nr:branched-chain-amino-acid transaminase [Geminicoccaceae bacterium]